LDEANTENSALVTGCKSAEARYLGELLGRYAHQKWILVFDPEPKSAQRLFIITFSAAEPADALRKVRQFGITVGAIVGPDMAGQKNDKLTRFYLWVQDHSQDASLRALATDNHGTVEELAGTGTLIGDDSRASAQKIFDRHIRSYERTHHRALSKLLWSRRLHDLGLKG